MSNRPVELLEESLQVLRGAGAPILLQYWTGAIPFAIALLSLLHDMSLSWGAELLLRDSSICAAAFVWLSYWKSRASRATFSLLTAEPVPPISWLKIGARQAMVQTLKLFVMPFAIASLLGWPAASTFFRTLTLETSYRRALSAATERYAENLLAFLIVAALTAVAYINILIVFLAVPTIWKVLTGYETDWSRMAMAGATGLAAVTAITTWILIDPWIQTYCLLRVFYQNARTDGRDLLRAIGRLAALTLICFLALPAPGRAAETSQQRLNDSIDHVAKGAEYSWLHAEKNTDRNFLTDLAQKISDSFSRAKSRVEVWWRRLRRELFGADSQTKSPNSARPHAQELRWTLSLLAVLICGGIVALFFRRGKTKTIKSGPAVAGSASAGILNESVLPSEVQPEEWLRQAFEYLSNNETRLAARAFIWPIFLIWERKACCRFRYLNRTVCMNANSRASRNQRRCCRHSRPPTGSMSAPTLACENWAETRWRR